MANDWGAEQIRVLVLGSLSIQIALIFLVPLRKRMANKVLKLTLWLFYLMADYVATLALGNILRKHTNIPDELTALWAPFLLLHLGGPDLITSYSVEDNELWWRHLLGLIVQVGTAGFVFLNSLPENRLWIPTCFIFVPGLLKYGERTLALRAASMDNFKDKIISEHDLSSSVDFVPSLSNITESTESELISEGYNWFIVFNRLLVDVTFSSKTLIKSQDRFSEVSSKHALKLVAIELSFLYDILHTKAVIVHCISGRVVRCCSFISIVTALVVFHYLEKTKSKYKDIDIIVTYILLGAGLGLEVVAVVLLLISDWTVVLLNKSRRFKFLGNAIVGIVSWILKNGKPRWSRTIGQYNLIAFCLRDKDNTLIGSIMSLVNVKHAWNNMRATKIIPLPDLLEQMMFDEAKRRAENVHIYKVLVEARSYRGFKALERHDQVETLEWSMRKEFDECIILWHIATDICFYKDISPRVNDQKVNVNPTKRLVSMNTSNYLVYLLTQQPSMMQIGDGKTRFEATCAVVKKKFKKFKGDGKLDHKKAHDVLELKEEAAPVADNDHQPRWRCWGKRKGEEDKRKYEDEMGNMVLKEGLRLAEVLQTKVDQRIKWQLISEIWMEMLGYAAIHCDSYQHAKSLSRGGEVLTHLWLLMAQMGVVDEHKIQQFQSESA